MIKDGLLSQTMEQLSNEVSTKDWQGESVARLSILFRDDIRGYIGGLQEKQADSTMQSYLNPMGYFCDGRTMYYRDFTGNLKTEELLNIVFEILLSRVNYTYKLKKTELVVVLREQRDNLISMGIGKYTTNGSLYLTEVRKIISEEKYYKKVARKKRGSYLEQLYKGRLEMLDGIYKRELKTTKVIEARYYSHTYISQNKEEFERSAEKGSSRCVLNTSIMYDKSTGRELSNRRKADKEKIREHNEKVAILESFR